MTLTTDMDYSATMKSQSNDDNDDLSFAELLDAYDYDDPERGQILDGIILEKTETDIMVDVGAKRDAFVPRTDLDRLDEELVDSLVKGQEIKVYVLQPRNSNGQLIVSINRALEEKDWERAEQLLESGETVSAQVVGTNKGGVLVSFGRIRGFVPNSHLLEVPRGQSRDEMADAKSDMVENKLQLKVIDINRQRNRLVLSERAAQQQARAQRMEDLNVGDVIEGTVVSLMPYGAFVDIGGVDGLIHVSELDWQFVEAPSDILKVGEKVKVRIEEVDVEKERISLSRKAVLPDPWQNVNEEYNVGDIITVNVTNVVDFGAFAMLPNGIVGLLHVSRMASYNPSHPSDVVRKGDELPVRIIEINTEDRQIALSLDDVSSDEQLVWLSTRSESDNSAALIVNEVENRLADNRQTVNDAIEDSDELAAAAEDIIAKD